MTYVFSCAATAKCIIGLQPLLFSCLNTPLLLLLISPSAFAWSDLYLHNTQSRNILFGGLHPPGQKQYSNTSPNCCGVIEFESHSPSSCWYFESRPQLIKYCIIPHPRNNVAGEARPLYSGQWRMSKCVSFCIKFAE